MDKRWKRSMAAALGALTLGALAPIAAAEVTEAEKAANAEAMALGKLIYQYDQAAWHSTDALRGAINPADYPDLGGWVVEPHGENRLLVTYFGQREGPRYALFRYVVEGSTVVEGGPVPKGTDSALSPLANRLVDARDAAAKRFTEEGLSLCTNSNANSVVLPPDSGGRIRVYLMSPSVTAGVFPLGGHYRFDIDEAGKVVSWRPFLKSCVMLDSRPDETMKKKAFFVVSHLLDPQPTEIHYFVRYNVPIDMGIVMTNQDIWMLGTDGFTNPKKSEIGLR